MSASVTCTLASMCLEEPESSTLPSRCTLLTRLLTIQSLSSVSRSSCSVPSYCASTAANSDSVLVAFICMRDVCSNFSSGDRCPDGTGKCSTNAGSAVDSGVGSGVGSGTTVEASTAAARLCGSAMTAMRECSKNILATFKSHELPTHLSLSLALTPFPLVALSGIPISSSASCGRRCCSLSNCSSRTMTGRLVSASG